MCLGAVFIQLHLTLEPLMLFETVKMPFLRLRSFFTDSPQANGVGNIPNSRSDSPDSISACQHVDRTRRRRSRLGAATIELALVAPFMFFVIFGAVEFGRMMMVKQALTNAAREGCRHATLVTIRDHDSAEAVVRDFLEGTVAEEQNANVVRVTVSPEFDNSLASGTEIVVVVDVDCADISWLPGTLFAGATVRGVAAMNRE